MEEVGDDIRVNVFKNGEYLGKKEFLTPEDFRLDVSCLYVKQVERSNF